MYNHNINKDLVKIAVYSEKIGQQRNHSPLASYTRETTMCARHSYHICTREWVAS